MAFRSRHRTFLGTLIVVGAVIAALACNRRSTAYTESLRSTQTLRLSAAEVHFEYPNASVASVGSGQILETIASKHALRPDSRVLGAVAEAKRLLNDEGSVVIEASFHSHRWVLRVGEEEAGSLSDTATFRESLDLLRAWSTRLLRGRPRLLGVPKETPELAQRRAAFTDPFSDGTMESLRTLEGEWRKGNRSAEALDLAGRALLTLCLQSVDRMGVADALYAKTLAVLAIREAAQGRRLPEEESQLAALMDYRTDSEELAEGLPETSPARLWTSKDLRKFRAEAERSGSDHLLRYLFLIRFAREVRFPEWSRWVKANCPELKGGFAFARAAMEVNDFGPDRESAELMLEVLFLQLVDQSAASRFWHAFLQSVESEPSGRQMLALLRRLQPPKSESEGILSRFENALASKTRGTGTLLDPETERAFYRSLFYSALHAIGVYELDERSSAPDAQGFAGSLKNGPPGPAADFARWFGDLARVKTDVQALPILIEDLGRLESLGQPAIRRIGDEVLRQLTAVDPRRVAASQQYRRRLDGRPDSRVTFGSGCLNDLDLSCYERYYGSGVRLAGREWYTTYPGFARYLGDREAVLRMADDSSLRPSARMNAIEILEKEKWADDEDLGRRALRVAEENPGDESMLDPVFRFLRDHGRLKDAEALARRLLREEQENDTLLRAHWASRLAEALDRQGRSSEAWKVIEPWVPTWKSDVMYAASSALESLGRHQEALEMARNRLERYPDGRFDRAELAELLWRQNRPGEVPAILQDRRHQLAPWDWITAVGVCFQLAFEHRPTADSEAALDPLIASGVNPWYLAELAKTMDAAHRPDAAFTLLTRITAKQPGVGAVDPSFNAYRYLKAWKGEEAAVEWVRSVISPALRLRALRATLDEGLLDLFWKIDDPPGDGPALAKRPLSLPLLRAVAAALAPDKAGHRADLLARFSKSKDSPDAAFGLFLLDAAPRSAILKIADNADRRGTAVYYLGIKAMGERRYDEASQWLLACLETAPPSSPEFLSAHNMLYRWAKSPHSLQTMGGEPLF